MPYATSLTSEWIGEGILQIKKVKLDISLDSINFMGKLLFKNVNGDPLSGSMQGDREWTTQGLVYLRGQRLSECLR